MSDTGNRQFNQDDELDFNDGLGDLLREKEKLEFSLPKTILSVITILLITIILITLSFKALKQLFRPSNTDQIIQEIPLENTLEEIEEEPTTVATKQPTEPKTETKQEALGEGGKTPEKQPTKPTEIATKYTPNYKFKIIAGSFSQYQNALRQKKNLAKQNQQSFIWKKQSQTGALYVVQVGAFKTYKEAKAKVAALNKKNIPTYILEK